MKTKLPFQKRDAAELTGPATTVQPTTSAAPVTPPVADPVDLKRRREELTAKVATLQWDLGGLTYEMATRDRIRVDLLVKRAAKLQEVDAELGEVERILRTEETGSTGACSHCGAPHSGGAVYCWQCGQAILTQVPSGSIFGP